MVTRGEKIVLQRWYSYAEQPFLSAQALRSAGDGMLPHQPLIVCDWTQTSWTNVTCRWYNSPKAIGSNVLHDEESKRQAEDLRRAPDVSRLLRLRPRAPLKRRQWESPRAGPWEAAPRPLPRPTTRGPLPIFI